MQCMQPKTRYTASVLTVNLFKKKIYNNPMYVTDTKLYYCIITIYGLYKDSVYITFINKTEKSKNTTMYIL